METILQYIKPEFMILVIVLYFLGIALKHARRIPDQWIPLLLTGCGILCSTLSVAGSTEQYHNVAAMAYEAITQGVLCAGMSVYIHQILKQCGGGHK